jgi:hypothetical protein
MTGCTVVRGCGTQPAAELRVTRLGRPVGRWQLACYRHAMPFVEHCEREGYGVEERPPQLIREVLDHEGDPDVIPITRAGHAA